MALMEMLSDKKRIKQALQCMYYELYKNEGNIIANNIGERAITHKMAEYLQKYFPDYNVDCEYNRNYEMGANVAKKIKCLKDDYIKLEEERLKEIKELKKDEIYESPICCYPDIIVHKRMNNNDNLLVIEVKKDNNNSQGNDKDFDYKKLRALTHKDGGYEFKYGVHIVIGIAPNVEIPLEETWFSSR